MKRNALPDSLCAQVSAVIADTMGLHFPQERWADLQRGLAGAAKEWGFDDIADGARWLLSASLGHPQLEVLAAHLTIGETYFFRDPKMFESLAARVLPGIIDSRRGRNQTLRFWSAGCCTGEEAYSLAILLHQILPDLVDWKVTILGTDINPRFLEKAVAGSYGEWSFRGVRTGLKEVYFTPGGSGRYDVKPEIKEMVRYGSLNLAEEVYPSLATGTNAMDLILCRNVLMYFTAEQVRKVIGNLHQALRDGGWLVASPTESSRELFHQFAPVYFPGVILQQKNELKDRAVRGAPPMFGGDGGRAEKVAGTKPLGETPEAPPRFTDRPRDSATKAREAEPHALAATCYTEGRFADVVHLLLPLANGRAAEPKVYSLLARALANQGHLADALTWCDRWLAAAKLDSAGHYLRAVVLLEQGNREEARRSLQRAIYLHPDFELAHFALGNLARGNNRQVEADRHFRNALQLLARRPAEEPLPEADDLTVGRLTATLTALTSRANAR